MAYAIARHTVKDYAAWRRVFDEFEPVRKQGGERSAVVLQADGNPNDVTVINTWDSVAAAKAFFGQEALKEAMQKAGVASEPQFFFGNNV